MTVTKERWLVVRVTLHDSPLAALTSASLQAAIRDSVLDNFGDFGAGCVLTLLQSEPMSVQPVDPLRRIAC